MSGTSMPGAANILPASNETEANLDELSQASLQQTLNAQIISQIPSAYEKETTDTSNFLEFFGSYRATLIKALDGLDLSSISELSKKIREVRSKGRSIYVFGNGGSASVATHLAADLGKIRFEDPKSFFRITSLSDNAALITATANDSGYNQVFSHQISRFVQPGDLVIAISSSGNSENIIEGLLAAKANDASSWAIVGFTGGEASLLADKQIYIPTNIGEYGAMEDISSVVVHLLVTYIHEEDKKIFK